MKNTKLGCYSVLTGHITHSFGYLKNTSIDLENKSLNALQKLKNNLNRNLSNIPGWSTKRKIVVIESDDWGSIRMSSKKAFQNLENAGISLAKNHYNTNDALVDMKAKFWQRHSHVFRFAKKDDDFSMINSKKIVEFIKSNNWEVFGSNLLIEINQRF